MMGKELDGLNFKELQQLESQLSEGILSVKNKKVRTKSYIYYTSLKGLA